MWVKIKDQILQRLSQIICIVRYKSDSRGEVFTGFFTVSGQQQHFFDSRLTYHASRSAMVGAMGAGYPLSQNWGYNNYSSYLGYNTGAATLPGYTQPSISSYPSSLDTVLPTTSASTSPQVGWFSSKSSFWQIFGNFTYLFRFDLSGKKLLF